MKTIREAANDLCDRWETILWKDVEHTAVFIHELRMALAQPEQEPLEYWNAVEGWVKIEEVRQHFETVSCGTIYKTGGEGRVPLYTTPPKREWVGLTDDALLKAYGWDFVSYGQSDRPSLGPSILDEAKQEIIDGLRKVEAALRSKNT